MSGRAWLAACLLAGFLGLVGGWSARVATADHRYIKALAERHEAAASYYNTRLDQQITANERTYGNGQKKNRGHGVE